MVAQGLSLWNGLGQMTLKSDLLFWSILSDVRLSSFYLFIFWFSGIGLGFFGGNLWLDSQKQLSEGSLSGAF